MIHFRPPGRALVRRGEFNPVPGVRARTRAVAYPGFEPAGADPWSGAYRRGGGGQIVSPGPGSVREWTEALRGACAGEVLVGPIPRAEPVYGAGEAAVAAARSSGRGVVAVDGLAALRSAESGADVVAAEIWRTGSEARLWHTLREASGRFVVGVGLPVLPGWTDDPAFLQNLLRSAREAGCAFVAPIEVAGDGASRAAIHEDFSTRAPERADAFFDLVHHGVWAERVAAARQTIAREIGRAGLRVRSPLPRGRGSHRANVAAREALERRADSEPEPLASRMRRAARIVEDLGRDLADLSREGNARLVFPPDSEEWSTIAAAVSGGEGRP
jgi:hypothetical protein